MKINYSTKLTTRESLYSLYECLGWNNYLQLDKEQLAKAMEQSWYIIYAYHENTLVGTGRVVSDGVINAYLCGLGVDPNYRNKGVGTEISKRLVEYCQSNNLHIQFFCEERLVPYYTNLGFEIFATGMKMSSNQFDDK